jgi:hypothetical protein
MCLHVKYIGTIHTVTNSDPCTWREIGTQVYYYCFVKKHRIRILILLNTADYMKVMEYYKKCQNKSNSNLDLKNRDQNTNN